MPRYDATNPFLSTRQRQRGLCPMPRMAASVMPSSPRMPASAPVPLAPPLGSYTLTELYDLEAQGTTQLAQLNGEAATRMQGLVARITAEIASRRGPANLAAQVCGYDDAGQLLDAKVNHTFARIQGRRG